MGNRVSEIRIEVGTGVSRNKNRNIGKISEIITEIEQGFLK
jgi:hypothetical protein